MGKGGKQRIVEWTGPDKAAEPAKRFRLAGLSSSLAGRWSLASGFARAAAAILVVSAVFVVVFRSMDGLDPVGESVRMPSIVKTVRVDPVPATAQPPTRSASKAGSWWLAPVDLEQSFFDIDLGRPSELCRRLAALGYARARWAESTLFKNEWECSSDLEGSGETSQSFVVVRGGGENEIGRLMLKLTATDEASRKLLIAKANAILHDLSDATGLVVSAKASSLLDAWRVGAAPTSQGAFRIVAEGGSEDSRVLTVAVTPPLERPPGDECRQACRNWIRTYGSMIGDAQRVTSVERTFR